MNLLDALKQAKEGKAIKALIHGAEVELTFQKRDPGCGGWNIRYYKDGRQTKDAFFSEHEVEAQWFEEAQLKGMSLKDLVEEIDNQP